MAGGDPAQAKKLINILGHVSLSRLDSNLKVQSALMSKFNQAQGPAGLTTSVLGKLFYRRQHEALASIITNPRWADDLTRISKAAGSSTSAQLADKVGDLMRKAITVQSIPRNESELGSEFLDPDAQ